MLQRALWGPIEDWFKICGFVLIFNGFWMFAPPIIVLASVYLLYTKFLLFCPCVLLYLAWFIHTRDWPESGCMPSDWARTHVTFMAWCGDYFNYRIVKTVELPADRNYIVGSHPHGMVCLGMTMSFASNASFCMSSMAGITELYKGWKTWTVTLAGQFHWPLRRELLMIGGAGISSKRNLTWILRQKEKGQAVTIVVGGLNEAIMTTPGKFHLKLKDRKGFIKLALTEGADLVPMYHFGENETYHPVSGICPKRLRNMQAHLMRTFGFCPPLLLGRSLLGLPWGGLVPHQVNLESVIGDAIRVEKAPNPTQEEIDQLHAQYCEKLNDLFEAHKANYGIRPDQKIVIY